MTSHDFKIDWDAGDGSWRIYQRKRKASFTYPWECLEWMRFASAQAARQHLDLHGHKYEQAQRSERKAA